MGKTYLSYNSIVSAYGMDSTTLIDQMGRGISGLTVFDDPALLPKPFCASRVDVEALEAAYRELHPREPHTQLEKMMLVSLAPVLAKSGLALDARVGLVVSTTKGNVDVLEGNAAFSEKRAYLGELAGAVSRFFGFQTQPLVLSNACVSGLLAVAVAKRLIRQGRFDHVFVVSGDRVSRFVLSGFDSFQALSDAPCRPYCKTRTGINLGEMAASVLVTASKKHLAPEAVALLGETSCNDANHISGPSRTGEGLVRAVRAAMAQAHVDAGDIDYISAHGTATAYNDEMEAIAFDRLDLSETPMNSLKGYFGHTLGASGLVETLVGMHGLHQNRLFASLGFQEMGVSKPVHIVKQTSRAALGTFLKTASGFGGCNAAAVFQKPA